MPVEPMGIRYLRPRRLASEDSDQAKQSALRAPQGSGATISGSWRCPSQTAPAGSKHHRQTTSDPRRGRHLLHTPVRPRFHDLWVPRSGMTNCPEKRLGRAKIPSFPTSHGLRNRVLALVVPRSDDDFPPRRTARKFNTRPGVLPDAGGETLGFVALSGSNCSAGATYQAPTTSDPRTGRHIHYMAGPCRIS